MMARSRNIKPGFFSNEHLAEVDFATRLLFIGMWTEADREGRLEDRPRRLKMALFPADNVDIDAMLYSLHDLEFIDRYSVNGRNYIQVVNWAKHQNPHLKEAKSTIPEKPVVEPCPVKTGASTMQAPDKNSSFPADSLSLDSGFLIPDSLIPDSPKQDQHSSHSASDEVPVSGAEQKPTPEESSVVEPDLESEQPLEPVNPKAPVEMTLDWEPDTKLLKNYALRMTLPVSIFTPEATASFVCHYTASGRMETQDVWVALLVKWIKTDRNQQSNVRQFPARRQSSEPDFDSNAWAKGLVVSP